MPPRSRARGRVASWLACVAVLGCGSGQSTGSPPISAPATTPRVTAAAPTASPSTVASAAASDPLRIPLSGAAPGAIVLDGDTAWVLTGEGGTLIEVDLVAPGEVRSIPVGFGATHLGFPLPGVAAVGRFDDSDTGGYTLLVSLETDDAYPVSTGEVGALAAGEGGDVWVLEKADRLVRVDGATGDIIGETPVDVGENVHVEVRWAGGAAWVGSDGRPLVRVDGEDLSKHETIEVGEGIPFLFEGGLLWGAGPSQLWALDPGTREITRQIALVGLIEILALDIEGDDAWIAARRPGHVGTVLQLDLETETVVGELAVELPAAVRIGPERVWVAGYTTNELLGFER